MKKLWSLCGILSLVCCVVTSVGFAQDEILTPYENWSQFKPGSFVTYKMSTETAGITTKTEITHTLKEVAADKIVLETKSVTETMGMKVDGPVVVLEIPKDGAMPADMTGGVDTYTIVSEGSTVEKKEGTIKVKDTEIDAMMIQVEAQDITGNTVVTLWYSPEFPGNTIQSKTEVKGPAAMTTEMMAIDFKVVK